MARIAGVDLPKDKRVEVSLTYIHGIGPAISRSLLNHAGVNPNTKVRELQEEEVSRIREVMDKEVRVEGELRREVSLNIKRLGEVGSYRGLRHRRGLPVRGQRTKTNARTKRGPRKTVAGRGQRRGMAKK
ncbi:30S ribosomal protein S13 [Chloroflexota bacterium]